jgi:hypothetical protein
MPTPTLLGVVADRIEDPRVLRRVTGAPAAGDVEHVVEVAVSQHRMRLHLGAHLHLDHAFFQGDKLDFQLGLGHRIEIHGDTGQDLPRDDRVRLAAVVVRQHSYRPDVHADLPSFVLLPGWNNGPY